MKNVISFLLAICFCMPSSATVEGYRSIADSIKIKTQANPKLTFVSNIPLSQVKPLDILRLEAFVDSPGEYIYRFIVKVDGTIKEARPSSMNNTFDYNTPAVFEKIEVIIEAIGLASEISLSKSLFIDLSSPLQLSKENVYQKDDLVVFHPLIKSGITYNVIFNNGVDYHQTVQSLAAFDGELEVKIPTYQKIEKLSISIEGLQIRERKKITVYPGAGISGNKEILKSFEPLILTIKEDINLTQSKYPASINGEYIELIKSTENALVWLVDPLEPGDYVIKFSIEGVDFNYHLNILPEEIIEDPESFVDNYLNSLNSKITEIENDINLSLELKQFIRAKYDEALQARNHVSHEELALIANYYSAHPISNTERITSESDKKFDFPEYDSAKAKWVIRQLLKTAVATWVVVQSGYWLAGQVGAYANACAVSSPVCALGALAAFSAFILAIKPMGRAYIIQEVKKVSIHVKTLRDLKMHSPYSNYIFRDRVPLVSPVMSEYRSLDMNDINSSEPLIREACSNLIKIRDLLQSFSSFTGINIDAFDISTYPRLTYNLQTDPKYVSKIENIRVGSSSTDSVYEWSLVAVGDKLELAFMSTATEKIDFNFDLKYSSPGWATTLTHIEASIEPLSGCNGEKGTFHINPDGTAGGYIADTAKATSEVYISSDSDVCGDSKLAGKVEVINSSVITNSKLTGVDIQTEGIRISQSPISNSTIAGGFLRIYQFSEVKDSTITGNYMNMYQTSINDSTITSQVNILNHYLLLDRSFLDGATLNAMEVQPETNGNSTMSIISSTINSSISGSEIWVIESTINEPESGTCFTIYQNNRQERCGSTDKNDPLGRYYINNSLM